MHDLYSVLRLRQGRIWTAIARRRIGDPPSHFPAFVGRVVADPNLPTATGRYFAVHPVSVLGKEVEGNPADLLEDPSITVYVCVLGTIVPAVGDDLVCRFIDNRWITERLGRPAGGGGGVIPGCACAQIPTALHQSSTGPCNGTFLACSLQYGPTPPDFASLDLGLNCFLSVETFHDPLLARDYRFFLGCDTIFFRLSRVYLASPDGGPYHDSTLYTWSLGQPGNTCSPFLLSSGTIYPGGDPGCTVTITE